MMIHLGCLIYWLFCVLRYFQLCFRYITLFPWWFNSTINQSVSSRNANPTTSWAKEGIHYYHFQVLWNDPVGEQTRDLPHRGGRSTTTPPRTKDTPIRLWVHVCIDPPNSSQYACRMFQNIYMSPIWHVSFAFKENGGNKLMFIFS